MKDYSPVVLLVEQDCDAISTRSTAPQFADWLAARPELWSVGPAIQEEMFATALLTPA